MEIEKEMDSDRDRFKYIGKLWTGKETEPRTGS